MGTKRPISRVWQFDTKEYIRQGEVEKAEKTYAWKTAIGLQDVDGLSVMRWCVLIIIILYRESMRRPNIWSGFLKICYWVRIMNYGTDIY